MSDSRKDRETGEQSFEEHDHPIARLPRAIGFLGRLRNYFLAGLLVSAPVAITVWITWAFIDFVDTRVVPLIPPEWNPEAYLPFSVPGLGVILVLAFLTLVGMLATGMIGRMLMRQGERLVDQVPVVRSIYGAVKQIFETVLAHQSTAFRQVVMIQYPHRGPWSLGFATGTAKGEVQRRTSESVVGVFIPAVPNPTTGFLLFVPEHEVKVLDMPVQQGLKLVVSGGIAVPTNGELRPPAKILQDATIGAPPPPPQRLRLTARLRNYLLAGVLVTAPISITLWLAWQVVSFIDSRITPMLPPQWTPEYYLPFDLPGLGVVIVLVGLTLIGMFMTGLIGRWVMRGTDWFLNRLPVVRGIYGALKQVLETILAASSDAFREVVLFQYPREGSWAIRFITGRVEGEVQEKTEADVINVFLPTTPNPTSGFLILVPRDEGIPLTMTVEEGFKMVVSGGLVAPEDRGEEPAESLAQGTTATS